MRENGAAVMRNGSGVDLLAPYVHSQTLPFDVNLFSLVFTFCRGTLIIALVATIESRGQATMINRLRVFTNANYTRKKRIKWVSNSLQIEARIN